MTLKDYIKGERKGKEANKLERDALNDPFLQDAIDGFDEVAGNHAEIVAQLEKRVTYIYSTRKKQRNWFYFGSIAASILFLIVSYYFLFMKDTDNSMLIAENKNNGTEQPETYLEETETLDIQYEEPQRVPIITTLESMESLACADEMAVQSDIAYEVTDMREISVEKEPIAAVSTESKQIVSEKIADESVAMADARSDSKRKDIQSLEAPAKAKETALKKESYKPEIYGEKEFLEYCKEKADKNVCAGKGAKIKVTFFINDAGKPEDIKISSFSCEEAKKEMEKLLNSSPVWTEKNRKVGMTVEW